MAASNRVFHERYTRINECCLERIRRRGCLAAALMQLCCISCSVPLSTCRTAIRCVGSSVIFFYFYSRYFSKPTASEILSTLSPFVRFFSTVSLWGAFKHLKPTARRSSSDFSRSLYRILLVPLRASPGWTVLGQQKRLKIRQCGLRIERNQGDITGGREVFWGRDLQDSSNNQPILHLRTWSLMFMA
jgi:hypothetical protein